MGLFIYPNHYYSPVSDVNQLEKSKDIWAKKSNLPGIDVDLDQQLENLSKTCLPFQNEFIDNKTYIDATQNQFGPGYGFVEAQALHAFIRAKNPRNIIEVGSGVSTYCMCKAIEINLREDKSDSNLTCIEPYPSKNIKDLQNINLIEKKVQSVPVSRFEELSAGDFLFIDSSHTVRPGGDVNYLILEVLPRLSSGVFIQLHDIFLPYDYPRNVLHTYYQWMETSLLRALLINNDKIQTIFCLSQLHYDRQDELKEIFPDYIPASDENGLEIYSNIDPDKHHFPASIYLKTL